jgi:hypothetical protein
VLIAPLALIGAIGFGWNWPSWSLAPLIVATGLCGWAAQLAQARGFAAADASVVAPFDFLRLPMTAIAAYFLFGEKAEIWTWIGAFIIFAAAYLLWAVQRVVFNKLDKPENQGLKDLSAREWTILVPLLAGILWLGLFPGPVLRRTEPAAQAIVDQVRRVMPRVGAPSVLPLN